MNNIIQAPVPCITDPVFVIRIQNDYEANILRCALHFCVGIIEDTFSRESNVGKTAKELETEADKKDGSKLHKNSSGEQIQLNVLNSVKTGFYSCSTKFIYKEGNP